MDVFADFLEKIEHPQHRDRTEEVLAWIIQKFPNLCLKSRGISLCLPIMAHLLLALAYPKIIWLLAPKEQGSFIFLMKLSRLATNRRSSCFVFRGAVRFISHYLRK